MLPALSEMQNAGPSTRVTAVPAIVALALVVHGWATGGTLSLCPCVASGLRLLRITCLTVRIAQIAPVWFPVPPSGYGGIELVVALLTDGLADEGYDVTLFASGGSRGRARIVSPLSEPPDPRKLGDPWYDAYHALAAYLHAGEFDVIHDHAGVVGPVLGALLHGKPPVIHTLHGPWTEETRLLYGLVGQHIHLVAISDAQRNDGGDIRHLGTVYNGIDLSAYEYRDAATKDDFLVYIGRANHDKGPVEAIEVARRAGLELTMIVKHNEPLEQAYFDLEVAPRLGADIELLENVSHEVKVDRLGRARGMVFPIRWPEPFGLVMVEAMACGTPVVTTNWGAAPELVADGETGFRRDGEDDLVEAVNRARGLDPAASRKRVEQYFSGEAMVRGYEAVYRAVASG
jgi:glycosyltransferase involved in cell wall biosynthesis